MDHCCAEVLAALARIESQLQALTPKSEPADSHVQQFVASNFEFSGPLTRTPVTAIYQRYLAWCEDKNLIPLGVNKLGMALNSLGFRAVRGTAGTRYRTGFKLT